MEDQKNIETQKMPTTLINKMFASTPTFNISDAEIIHSSNIESFVFDEEKQTIEIIKREEVESALPSINRDSRIRVLKEVYGVENGKLKLIKNIEAKVTPGHWVDEAIEFEDEKKKNNL